MSEPTLYLDGRVAVHAGDCADAIKTIADNSIDAVVTDPPYSLTSIVKRFGKTALGNETCTSDRSRKGADGYARFAKGFMGKAWDNGSTAFSVDFWAEVWRVLKPGAHVVVFGGTRTYHRLACAIEDAGLEVRDQLAWCYGTGFPKSHDVAKGIDRNLGIERPKIRVDAREVRNATSIGGGRDGLEGATRPWIEAALERGYHEAVSDEAVSWRGWGTALKPAWEPICLARKPLSEPTVAANVHRWGTGAINIGACRIETDEDQRRPSSGGDNGLAGTSTFKIRERRVEDQARASGRWPANLVLEDCPEVRDAFPAESGGGSVSNGGGNAIANVYSGYKIGRSTVSHNDSGSAARFFYSAKADADDRLGSRHPTVKPLDLMQWLCRLITPKGGTILDPFSGTGTTGEAAYREGFNAVLIEREAEYLSDIERRMKLCLAGPDERARESIKARNAGKPDDYGPLFGGIEVAGRQIYGKFADQIEQSDQRGSNGEDR